MSAEQLQLFSKGLREQFDEYVHTDEGRKVADRFIRIAWGFLQRGRKVGAKAIWERLRWNYEVKKAAGQDFALNNNWTAYMARFAMEREPRLAGFFEVRKRGGHPRPVRAVVIPIARCG